ncbi:ALDH-like protein [Rhodotorula sp. JG-1b]|nr:ALDH-like protein [Rhodotorula sp. JG-1b]
MVDDKQLARRLRSLRTTATDGTVAFPRFQQDQLVKLHNVLVVNREELVASVQQEVGLAEIEVQIELAETLAHIKALGLSELDYTKWKKCKETQLREEGVVEKGQGVVAIVADSAAPVFSVFAPLATAIAASNAAICILSDLPPALASLLQSRLTASLDRSAFLFSADTDLDALAKVEQGFSPAVIVSRRTTQAGASGTTVLVDRLRPSSLLLSRAARLIVRGASHAGGRLPGSVARVLVHDETAGALIDALLEQVRVAYGQDPSLSADLAKCLNTEASQKLADDVRRETEKGTGRVLCGGAVASKSSGSAFPPTFIENPSRDLLSRNLNGPVVSIATFGSHEDALYNLGLLESDALYCFSDESEVLEYLAEETDAAALYANDVPLRALYDPLRGATDVHKYQKKVVYVSAPKATAAVESSTFFAPFTPTRRAQLANLLPRSPLSLKRAQFSHPILRVFFLQGVFLTVGTVLSLVLGTTGYGLWSLARRFLFTRAIV